ncbi:hypothetical protein [Owenweeksia hongkongensis]|uniref:hypothetical protein n=1 Tax=Owenweeksia hongkongensis TaxID=253245 RepID=UPI003A921344
MNKLKQIALQIPEYLLIASVIFYWGSAGWGLNPIAISLLLILVLQIIFKNRIVGLLIPGILILTCLYMLLALMSEFREFPSFNQEAQVFLFVGLSYFISTMLVSGLMIYKYLLREGKLPTQ